MEYGYHPFCVLFRDMTSEEYDALQVDIVKNGIWEAITTYKGLIVDGRHRHKICLSTGITPRYEEFQGTEEELLEFVISKNLNRRHLDTVSKAKLGLGLEKLFAKFAADRKAAAAAEQARCRERTENGTFVQSGAGLPSGHDGSTKDRKELKSNERAARIARVSPRSISEAKRIQEKAPEVFEKMGGDITLQDAKAMASLPIQTRQKILAKIETGRHTKDAISEVRKEERQEQIAGINIAPLSERWRIMTGDIADQMKLIGSESVDAIICDPPYGRSSLADLEVMEREASRVLKDGGLMLVMIGKYYLPEVMSTFSKYLSYYWMLAVVYNNVAKADAISTQTGVNPNNVIYLSPAGIQRARDFKDAYKVVLVYVNGSYKNRTGIYPMDVIRGGGREKDLHPWQQAISEFEQLVSMFTCKGDVVLDCFAGSGTTLIAALKADCFVIGIDNDENAINMIKARISEYLKVEGIAKMQVQAGLPEESKVMQ